MSLVQAIKLPSVIADRYKVKDNGIASDWIQSLTRINLFVGPNNSGKSALIRNLFASMIEGLVLPSVANAQIFQIIRDYTREVKAFLKVSRIHDIDTKITEELTIINRVNSPSIDTRSAAVLAIEVQLPQSFRVIERLIKQYPGHGYSISSSTLDNLKLFENSFNEIVLKAKQSFFGNQKLYLYYVPVLRSGKKLAENDPLYVRTLKDYFQSHEGMRSWNDDDVVIKAKKPGMPDTSHRIVSGQELYSAVKQRLLGSRSERDSIDYAQDFLTKHFFDNQETLLIPHEKERRLYIAIGREEERSIEYLGDGLQHILMMMLPLLLHKEDSVIMFIEEPELCLHPGFQRLLMESILLPGNGRHQIFATTHSNHVLDSTLDQSQINVYKLNKIMDYNNASLQSPKFEIIRMSSADKDMLSCLGVRESSVFLSNCTIWVEGITDRYYLRHFLDIYMKSLGNGDLCWKEDLHYSFVLYGGSSIVHYSFLDRQDGIDVNALCARLLLIADRDEKKGLRHKELMQVLGNRCIVHDRREIENVLLPRTIKSVVRSYGYAESEISQFDYDQYSQKYLGNFIEKHVLPPPDGSNRKRQFSTKGGSGTIAGKVEFARRSISVINTIDDMSKDAIALADRMFKFISEQNGFNLS